MNRSRIVVLDGYTLNPGDNPWEAIVALGELDVRDRTPVDQLLERSRDADVIVTNKAPLSAQTIARLPKLRFIAVTATGYNVVDIDAAAARGITVSNVPEYGTSAVAQYTFAMILELCHRIGQHADSVHRGEWSRNADWCYWLTPQVELAGLTMGIVGFGRIGRRVGELAHAFGMRVLAHSPKQVNPPGYTPFAWAASLDELAGEADVLSLHCPLTSANQGMVNRSLLGRMKPTALLINTARGALVNEQDLADALNAGVIAGAAVDVVSHEPIRAENPLLAAKNCLITPHMAWTTLAARQRLMRTTAENIAAFLRGSPINVVNRPYR